MLGREDLFVTLIRQTAEHVISLFDKYQQPYLLYHDVNHTKFVVGKTEEIAHHYSLNEKEFFILLIAAWFHDTGLLFTYGKNHEMTSVSLMIDFLVNKNIDDTITETIKNCILATEIPHHPKSFLEEIICDADTFNLGTINFLAADKLLKQEYELRENKKLITGII